MKTTRIVAMSLMALSLGAVGAIATAAEHKGRSPMGMDMAHEPHHVLAMAYHRNLATFAKALHDQTAGASSVNVEFARTAVAEMRRSFDQMKQQHQACMQAMSPEMQTKMKDKMQQMEPHQNQLNEKLTALEQEVQAAVPDPKKVSTLASNVLTQLDAMSKMYHGSRGKGMKM
jgi:polyhydroxyalkanoate synthesis regulator phasin